MQELIARVSARVIARTFPVKRIKWRKLKDSKVKNKFKMEVIESRILGGQEDWQRVAEMIRSIVRIKLGETSRKVSSVGKRGGGTRKSRRN